MGKIPAGILGRVSGKVGDVVGASWKGIAYIRQYVIPANPNTAAQQAERTLFGDLVWMAKATLGPVLQIFWDPFLRANSGWAHFIGLNRKLYLTQDDYSTIQLASGTLEGQVITTAVYTGADVAVVWDPQTFGNGDAADKACCFIYDKVNKVGFFNGTVNRSVGSAIITVGSDRTVGDLNAWLFFSDHETAPTKISYSDYNQVSP